MAKVRWTAMRSEQQRASASSRTRLTAPPVGKGLKRYGHGRQHPAQKCSSMRQEQTRARVPRGGGPRDVSLPVPREPLSAPLASGGTRYSPSSHVRWRSRVLRHAGRLGPRLKGSGCSSGCSTRLQRVLEDTLQFHVLPANLHNFEWSRWDSNPRPPPCKGGSMVCWRFLWLTKCLQISGLSV